MTALNLTALTALMQRRGGGKIRIECVCILPPNNFFKFSQIFEVTMTTKELVIEIIRKGMSQKRIAEYVGGSQGAVSLWLSGKREAGGVYYAKLLKLNGEI